MAPNDIIDYPLGSLDHLHGVATGMCVPFVISRLQDDPGATEAMLTVQMRGFGDGQPAERRIRLRWSADQIPTRPFPVQAHIVTEWAALGVAGGVILACGGLRLLSVAVPGDCFDFWVSDGTTSLGLEVSGTITGDLESRHQEKVRQLRDNPHDLDGFVVTVNFSTRTVIFSANRYREEGQ